MRVYYSFLSAKKLITICPGSSDLDTQYMDNGRGVFRIVCENAPIPLPPGIYLYIATSDYQYIQSVS